VLKAPLNINQPSSNQTPKTLTFRPFGEFLPPGFGSSGVDDVCRRAAASGEKWSSFSSRQAYVIILLGGPLELRNDSAVFIISLLCNQGSHLGSHIGHHLVFSITEINWNLFRHIPWVAKHINRHKKYISGWNNKENMVISIISILMAAILDAILNSAKMLKAARVASFGFWLRGSRWPRNRWKTSDMPRCTIHLWTSRP